MADEKKENEKPENESELFTMHHIVSDGKAEPRGEGEEVFGFEPQPLGSAAAVGQDKEKESSKEESKEEKTGASRSADHHIISDGWSAK